MSQIDIDNINNINKLLTSLESDIKKEDLMNYSINLRNLNISIKSFCLSITDLLSSFQISDIDQKKTLISLSESDWNNESLKLNTLNKLIKFFGNAASPYAEAIQSASIHTSRDLKEGKGVYNKKRSKKYKNQKRTRTRRRSIRRSRH